MILLGRSDTLVDCKHKAEREGAAVAMFSFDDKTCTAIMNTSFDEVKESMEVYGRDSGVVFETAPSIQEGSPSWGEFSYMDENSDFASKAESLADISSYQYIEQFCLLESNPLYRTKINIEDRMCEYATDDTEPRYGESKITGVDGDNIFIEKRQERVCAWLPDRDICASVHPEMTSDALKILLQNEANTHYQRQWAALHE